MPAWRQPAAVAALAQLAATALIHKQLTATAAQALHHLSAVLLSRTQAVAEEARALAERLERAALEVVAPALSLDLLQSLAQPTLAAAAADLVALPLAPRAALESSFSDFHRRSASRLAPG